MKVNCNKKIINSECYFTLRNIILKKLIYDDVKKTKIVVKTAKIIYNKLISKYYEINEKYYKLSEEERAIIEAVISLTY
jgi:hypothetical protein